VIAGIDFSSRAVDVVLLDEDTDAATWHRFELDGDGAFDRTRSVRAAMPGSSFWDDVLAVGIEQPRGRNALVALGRVQGAVLACIPVETLVHPLNPSSWRQAVGLPGNCGKAAVRAFVAATIKVGHDAMPNNSPLLWPHLASYWSQDACDAYCIALATRSLLQREAA
jgi:hypothetical protein